MPAMAKTPASEALQTALAFLRRTAELAADERAPVRCRLCDPDALTRRGSGA